MMQKKLFEGVLANDDSLTFEVTEELILTGILFGTNFQLLKAVYKTYRNFETYFEHQPMVGAKVSIRFDYDQQTAVIDRQTSQTQLTMEQFLQYIGKIDVTFGPIYPIGTIVELDEEMLPESLTVMFQDSDLGVLATLTGRKIPLITGFDQYIIDYLGRLWPFGETPGVGPVLISNMMIKRVVSESYTNEYEKSFAFNVLRATQTLNQQISTAYMTTEDAVSYYETLTKLSE